MPDDISPLCAPYRRIERLRQDAFAACRPQLDEAVRRELCALAKRDEAVYDQIVRSQKTKGGLFHV
ncbi:MAG: hypothetical protein IJL59_02135 [Clostridia bacterium]|jgi:hypothetical protein|nr:hypothetical protein [Clostridia bacterium]MBR3272003.1 hypothetical protein [Clostridia bacterium]